jgi:hypothetical protein
MASAAMAITAAAQIGGIINGEIGGGGIGGVAHRRARRREWAAANIVARSGMRRRLHGIRSWQCWARQTARHRRKGGGA